MMRPDGPDRSRWRGNPTARRQHPIRESTSGIGITGRPLVVPAIGLGTLISPSQGHVVSGRTVTSCVAEFCQSMEHRGLYLQEGIKRGYNFESWILLRLLVSILKPSYGEVRKTTKIG